MAIIDTKNGRVQHFHCIGAEANYLSLGEYLCNIITDIQYVGGRKWMHMIHIQTFVLDNHSFVCIDAVQMV